MSVCDRAYNHKVVKSWRSEDYKRAAHRSPYEQVRLRGAMTCEALNRGEKPPTHFGYRRPTPNTCADCGKIVARQSVRCQDCYHKTLESPHGTPARYTNHKCRCAECRRAWREYMREYMYRTGRNLTHFRPACPRCSVLQMPDALYCAECGCRLYPAFRCRDE